MKLRNNNLSLKKILGIVTSLLLVPSLLFNFYLYQKNQKLESVYKVEGVIDGDSLILKNDQSIRLGNIDAPELKLCGGSEAKKRLEDLVLGKTVKLDVFSHDRFNRPLAMVYIDNILVNEVLLKEGLVRYDGTPSPQRENLKKAYDYAFENRIGIFSPLCLSEKPEDSECLIKGNISRADKKKTYHFSGCSGYQQVMVEKDFGESWFCSEKEAKEAGYGKSENCFGKSFKQSN